MAYRSSSDLGRRGDDPKMPSIEDDLLFCRGDHVKISPRVYIDYFLDVKMNFGPYLFPSKEIGMEDMTIPLFPKMP